MLLRSLTRIGGWEEFTERHLKELRTHGVDETAIRELLLAEGSLRPDARGRMFVLAEKLEAHARTLLGLPAVDDGYYRPKHILEVLPPPRREKSFHDVLAEACSGGAARGQLEAAQAEERQRNAEMQRQTARSVRAVAFAEAFAAAPDAITVIRQALDAFLSHFTASEMNAIERFPDLVRANASAFGTYFAAWRRGQRDMVPGKQLPSAGDLLEAKLLGRRRS